MARAAWTLTAEDELTEPAYWIAVEDERPLTARRVVEEFQHKGCVPVSKPMPDKRGRIPAELSPILRRRLSRKTWIKTVLNIGRWFRLAAGPVASLAAEAARRSHCRLQGVSHSRAAFA